MKNKPEEMLAISLKATVPVLQLTDGKVIDESIDIMLWALTLNDPLNLLNKLNRREQLELIKTNDSEFKPSLDYYKYASRFPEKTEAEYRNDCDFFLTQLEVQLNDNRFLFGEQLSLADIAIFPFIRQFAGVDRRWFEQAPYKAVRRWLLELTSSEIFANVMTKFSPWKDDNSSQLVFPFG